MSATAISPTYFREELARFRDLCGSKHFWEGPQDKRSAAFKGITVLYLSTPDLSASEIDGYRLAIENYDRRALYFLTP